MWHRGDRDEIWTPRTALCLATGDQRSDLTGRGGWVRLCLVTRLPNTLAGRLGQPRLGWGTDFKDPAWYQRDKSAHPPRHSDGFGRSDGCRTDGWAFRA